MADNPKGRAVKNALPTPEVLCVPGGIAASANFSVDPAEDPEEARLEARRRARNAGARRRQKRRRLEKAAAGKEES
jgi:hypothetical protein